MEILIGILFFSIIIGSIMFLLMPLSIDLYFLRLDVGKHPVLKQIVDGVLKSICAEEGITTIHKSFEEMNIGVENKSDMALGLYVYTLNPEDSVKMRQNYMEVKNMEHKYGMPYKDICKKSGIDTNKTAEDFLLPRIELCDEKLLKYGLNSYYATYFHELGHHFAIRKIGEHTEENANEFGREIVLERLPFLFQLLPEFRFEYRLKLPELTKSEKRKAYLEYLKYYLKYIKTIITKKNGT